MRFTRKQSKRGNRPGRGENAQRGQAPAAGRSGSSRRKTVLKALLCLLVGALFAALALLVGDADYHATAIGWVPLIMWAVAIAASWAYVRVLKRGVAFTEATDMHDCPRDSAVHFTVGFHNRTPLFGLQVEPVFYLSDMFGNTTNQASTTLALAPFERYDFSFETTFPHIGTYRAGLREVHLGDLLGLFSATLPNKRHRSVLVTPNVRDIARIEFSMDAETEAQNASKSIIADSMDYAYVRDYEPGDPLKTIHWKLSSRNPQGGYYTRLFERYTNPGVAVLLDLSAPDDDADTLMQEFDAVVEAGLSVARYAGRNGFDTQLVYRNRTGETARVNSWQRDDLPRIMGDMPRLATDAEARAQLTELLQGEVQGRQGKNNLVVCTANVNAQIVSAVMGAKMQRRNPIVIAVVPAYLVESDLDKYVAPLGQLDDAGIAYRVIHDARQLEGAVL